MTSGSGVSAPCFEAIDFFDDRDPHPGPWNMAADEVLLGFKGLRRPLLRHRCREGGLPHLGSVARGLLGGMVIWGLQPGPRLFTDQPDFVWPLVGSFYVSNFIALVVNLAFIPLFLWMLRMPFTILAP